MNTVYELRRDGNLIGIYKTRAEADMAARKMYDTWVQMIHAPGENDPKIVVRAIGGTHAPRAPEPLVERRTAWERLDEDPFSDE